MDVLIVLMHYEDTAAQGLRLIRDQTWMPYKFVLDRCFVAPSFQSERSECDRGRKLGKTLHFWTPCKNKSGLVEKYVKIIPATPRF